MNIGSNFGKLRDVMKEVKNQNNAQAAGEAAKAGAAAGAAAAAGMGSIGGMVAGAAAAGAIRAGAELNPQEKLQAPPKAGSAFATLSKDPESAIKAFQKAANGKQIPIANSKNPNDTLKSVLEFAKSKLDKSEMMNVFKFMGEIDSSNNSAKLGKAIQENGLTTEQLDLIASGEFTSKHYLSMINQGDSAV